MQSIRFPETCINPEESLQSWRTHAAATATEISSAEHVEAEKQVDGGLCPRVGSLDLSMMLLGVSPTERV